ncbi:hypothetical protein [Polaromonas sp. DSR2-3-2]
MTPYHARYGKFEPSEQVFDTPALAAHRVGDLRGPHFLTLGDPM